ncbi:MAG: hypothetical protein PHE67_04100 [Campylobacterales bacterium]|nr:hypothetical protein [Campylobacterales bacterium]
MTLGYYEKSIKRNIIFASIAIMSMVLVHHSYDFVKYFYSDGRLTVKNNDIASISQLETDNLLLEKRIEGNKKLDELNKDIREMNERCKIKKDIVLADMQEISRAISNTHEYFDIEIVQSEEDKKYANLINFQIAVRTKRNNINDEFYPKYQAASRELVFLFLTAFYDDISIYNNRPFVKKGDDKIDFTLINKCKESL